jgi:hypothetical protein
LHISAKGKPNLFQERFGNRLAVPEHIVKECEAAGKALRWVSANELYANNGYHKNGWEAYKSTSAKSDFRNGNDPEGIVRRGDMILADRATTALGRDRKASQRQAAAELRKMAQDSGIDTVIEEGDEEND